MERKDNYALQMQQAKKLFLSRDQQELIRRCRVRCDGDYLYTSLLAQPYRIHRRSADFQRLEDGCWVSSNSFGEVMTLLDWLCDSRPDRCRSGRWVNITTLGHAFHTDLQERPADPDAVLFSNRPEAFRKALRQLGGKPAPGGDISCTLELMDGLELYLQLWFGDEEFAPRLCFLWDENILKYIRYETTWFLRGLIAQRLREAVTKIVAQEK